MPTRGTADRYKTGADKRSNRETTIKNTGGRDCERIAVRRQFYRTT